MKSIRKGLTYMFVTLLEVGSKEFTILATAMILKEAFWVIAESAHCHKTCSNHAFIRQAPIFRLNQFYQFS
jgi:hypothetical protein